MENRPLPEIVCKSCWKIQPYRKQSNCIHCGTRLSHWHVAKQLTPAADKRAS